MSLSVCVPRGLAAFSALSAPVAVASCEAAGHTDVTVLVTVDVLPVDKPLSFLLPSLSLSTPGVAVPGDTVGLPLALYVSNPNTLPLWSAVVFTLSPGWCGVPVSQSVRAGVAPLPFDISPSNGSIAYTAAVALAPSISLLWLNPLTACAVVTNGGGMSASINMTVAFAPVVAQLTVLPTVLSVTHYAFGASLLSVAVSLYLGTHTDLTWRVSSAPPPAWCLCTRVSPTAAVVTVNSSALASVWGGAPTVTAQLALVTSGTLIAGVPVAVLLAALLGALWLCAVCARERV